MILVGITDIQNFIFVIDYIFHIFSCVLKINSKNLNKILQWNKLKF